MFNYSAIIFTTNSAYQKQAEDSVSLQLLHKRGPRLTFRKTKLNLAKPISPDFLLNQESERNFSKEAGLGSCSESPCRRASLLLA